MYFKEKSLKRSASVASLDINRAANNTTTVNEVGSGQKLQINEVLSTKIPRTGMVTIEAASIVRKDISTNSKPN